MDPLTGTDDSSTDDDTSQTIDVDLKIWQLHLPLLPRSESTSTTTIIGEISLLRTHTSGLYAFDSLGEFQSGRDTTSFFAVRSVLHSFFKLADDTTIRIWNVETVGLDYPSCR